MFWENIILAATFKQVLIDHISNTLDHIKMLPPYLEMGFDRSQFVKHGEMIPKNLTDIENVFASDINASLLIIEPNKHLFDEMITQLQTPIDQWFGVDKEHSGFWLGNNFYDFWNF